MGRVLASALLVLACAGCGGSTVVDDGGATADGGALDAGQDSGPILEDAGRDAGHDAGPIADAGDPRTPLARNRDRLLGTYLDHLRSRPDATQSNGLRGADLASVCDLWARLDPSAQAVYLTLTARMQGSILGSDGSTMLDHVTRLYRLSGGEGATATDPGSCGGAEYNRMIMSMDEVLLAALTAANDHGGARDASGTFDLADIPADGSWRDSHDLGGPHDPFDRSDETNDGAPRAQAHYFADPSSSAASSPLGRLDLETLVDPHALELDQDYDCAHSSNPLCEYTLYGPACFPRTRKLGLDIYVDGYGGVEPEYLPLGC